MSEWIYINDDNNRNRFVLGKKCSSPLLCIGVNPSTATPDKPDPTIRSVERISAYNGYNGWIMLNLYPQRATKPKDIDQTPDMSSIAHNLLEIRNVLSTYDVKEIWAAWGNLIGIRPFLVDCLREIYSIAVDYNWINIGGVTKAGNPRHPLFLKTDAAKSVFDVSDYLDSFHG